MERLNKEKEALRADKDKRIKSLEQEKEEQRVSYEKQINELDAKLKSNPNIFI